ncbi:mechanosensitive ion channel family protein [Gemmiger sp.]|uniref:mechanosensitive ion channel family protein n=1 Tax=Gemmiger sp. TaxID=2049027 RepID=UPI002A75B211|nr:mechanosensitive ion channel family protein [Gemmiger sp.]MDY2693989.1 mechanosensitive ion channel family protein [Gemmiger sp.]MDY6006770.1 mechanosensitive ion channel family protein [Gemmiger sp.]
MLIESVDFSLAALLPALILGASAYLLPVLYRRFAKSLLQKLHALMPEVLQILSEAYLEPTTLLLRTFLGYAALHALPVQFAEKFPVYSVLALFFRLCVIFFIGYGAWRAAPMCHLLLRSAENHLDLATNKTMGRFFENIYKVLVVVFAGIAALDQLGVPVSGLLTGAGVAGLAISLAAQSTLSSLIAGITLVLEHPFGIGDYIILSSVEGTVEDISFRSTRIRNLDNVVITIENSKVCAEYIQNANQRTSRLWQFTLGLTYDTTEEQIQRVTQDLTQLLQDQPTVQPNGVTVTLDKFNDYSLDILVRVYLTTLPYADYLKERHRLNLLIMQTVKNAGCEFAFPTTTVEMAKDK